MSNFIMLVGPAASGKSSYAEARKYFNNEVILSSDAIREELYGDASDQRNPDTIFKHMFNRSVDALKQHKTVIYDATNLSSRRRTSFLKQLRAAVKHPILTEAIIFVCTPVQLLKNNQSRERHVPGEVIHRQIASFQCPTYEEGWDEISIHNGKFKDGLKFMLSLGIGLMKAPHMNPHHDNTIGEHCLEVMKIMDSFGTNTLPALTGLLHDCGKLHCQDFDENSVAHYYNHDNYSAYLSLLLAPLMEKDDALLMSWTIGNHMKKFHYQDEEKFESWFNSLPRNKQELLHLLMYADKIDSH